MQRSIIQCWKEAFAKWNTDAINANLVSWSNYDWKTALSETAGCNFVDEIKLFFFSQLTFS